MYTLAYNDRTSKRFAYGEFASVGRRELSGKLPVSASVLPRFAAIKLNEIPFSLLKYAKPKEAFKAMHFVQADTAVDEEASGP